MCFPLPQCLQRPTLQLCPAAKAALKSHKVRRCTSSSSPLFISLCCELNPLLLPTAGSMKKIFMKEADAATFFRKRSRRASKSQDEINGEFTVWTEVWSADQVCVCCCVFVVIDGIRDSLYKNFLQQRFTYTQFLTVMPQWKSYRWIQISDEITNMCR